MTIDLDLLREACDALAVEDFQRSRDLLLDLVGTAEFAKQMVAKVHPPPRELDEEPSAPSEEAADPDITLSQREREVLQAVRRSSDGVTIREIATSISKPEGTVRHILRDLKKERRVTSVSLAPNSQHVWKLATK